MPTPPATRVNLPERFWRKVQKSDDCWLWIGATKPPRGYGVIHVGNQRREYAHRIAWELVHGPIPQRMHVLHHCDNPPCVRPDHLFLGTHADNMADMASKGRANRMQPTHCRWGHLYDDVNTYRYTVNGGPRRGCRECLRRSGREYRRRTSGWYERHGETAA